MLRLEVGVLLALAACTGGGKLEPVEDRHGTGLDTEDYFPTDGARRAEYANTDTAVPWLLVVEKVEPTELLGEVELVTFEWSREDTGELLGAVKWGHDDDVAIYAWAGPDGAFVTLNPPVVLGDDDVYRDDVETTVSGGYTFTSTYVGPEDCPVAWGLEWEDCAHFRLDDGDGDAMTGPIFVGDYWLVPRYGPAWMHTTGYAGKWDLAHYDWDPEE